MKHVWLHIAVILAASVLLVAQGYIGPKGYIGTNGYVGNTPGVPTLVQYKACTGVSTPVTCTYNSTPTSGNTLVFMAFASGKPCVSVTGSGDTFVLWQSIWQPGTNPNNAAVFVANNVTTSNSFTVSCPSASNFMGAGIYEIANVNTADVTGAAIGSSTAISIPTTFAVGSPNEYVIAEAFEPTNYTTWTAGSGYTQDGTFFTSGGHLGASQHGNSVSGLSGVQTATMTTGTGFFNSGAIVTLSNSLAQGQANSFIDFEGLSDTVAPTIAQLSNSVHGPAGGSLLPGQATWVVHNPGSSLTGSVNGQLHNFLTNQQIGATSYNGSGSIGFQYATGTAGDYIQWDLPATYSPVSIGYWFETDIPQNDSVSNDYSLGQIQDGANDAVNPQIQPTGTILRVALECRSGGSASTITISTSTVYWLTFQAQTNAGACTSGTNCALDSLAIYDTTGAQVGSTITCSSASGNNPWSSIQIGISGGETESAGHHIWTDDVQVNYLTGTFPLLP